MRSSYSPVSTSYTCACDPQTGRTAGSGVGGGGGAGFGPVSEEVTGPAW